MNNSINLQNGNVKVKKREVDLLLSKYSIKDIETSLIKIFLEKNNIKTRNESILLVLKQNHNKIKIEIEEYLNKLGIVLDLKTIERFFELLIEPEDRKLNGAFYTPTFIVDYVVNDTINNDEKICDLSCGSGAFLIGATQRIHEITKKPIIKVIEQNIFGGDISKTSVYRSKILLTLFALINGEDKKEINFNLVVADSLNYNWKNNNPSGFDVVIGNPPYVRVQNMPKQSREDIHKRYFTASKGNIDLYIPFFELGIRLLNENGKIGYITPNSYFYSRASKKLREFLQQQKYVSKIIDFNHLQLFEGVTTYTCVTILDKRQKNSFKYSIIHEEEKLKQLNKIEFTDIKISSLSPIKWNLLLKEDYENIKKIESIGIPLGKLTQIKNGIATLNDNLYILEGETKEGFYIKEYSNKEYLIEKEITRKLVKASVLRTEEDIEKTKTRIIFPYEKIDKLYKPISENALKTLYPECYKYFLAIKLDLAKRDKGNRQYDKWFAYGRVQGYNISGPKLISPLMSPGPRFAICNEDKTLYNGGIGIFYKGSLELLQKILKSKVFWYYILKTSKEYKSNFRAVANNFIENFGIPNFTQDEKDFLIKEKSQEKIDNFLIKRYGVNI